MARTSKCRHFSRVNGYGGSTRWDKWSWTWSAGLAPVFSRHKNDRMELNDDPVIDNPCHFSLYLLYVVIFHCVQSLVRDSAAKGPGVLTIAAAGGMAGMLYALAVQPVSGGVLWTWKYVMCSNSIRRTSDEAELWNWNSLRVLMVLSDSEEEHDVLVSKTVKCGGVIFVKAKYGIVFFILDMNTWRYGVLCWRGERETWKSQA